MALWLDRRGSRRDFLRLAAGAAAVAASGAACNSGSSRSAKPERSSSKTTGSGERTLRIAQLSHFVPAYDAWFDSVYTQQWGERNGVEVVVDHIPYADLPTRAAAEAAAGRGHDLFFSFDAAATLEDDVIDHGPIVAEVEAKVGKLIPAADRATLNPKTNKRFAFPDSVAAFPMHYRADLWAATGTTPDTWEDVLRAAPDLKRAGHPLGTSFSPDFDGDIGLLGLMQTYGASIQDEENNVAINRPATLQPAPLPRGRSRPGPAGGARRAGRPDGQIRPPGPGGRVEHYRRPPQLQPRRVEEVLYQFLIPKMFAAAARGDMTPEEAIKAAEAQIMAIFDKWREKGKI